MDYCDLAHSAILWEMMEKLWETTSSTSSPSDTRPSLQEMEAEELESPILKLKAGMDSVEVERERRGKSVQRDPTDKDMREKHGWVITGLY